MHRASFADSCTQDAFLMPQHTHTHTQSTTHKPIRVTASGGRQSSQLRFLARRVQPRICFGEFVLQRGLLPLPSPEPPAPDREGRQATNWSERGGAAQGQACSGRMIRLVGAPSSKGQCAHPWAITVHRPSCPRSTAAFAFLSVSSQCSSSSSGPAPPSSTASFCSASFSSSASIAS